MLLLSCCWALVPVLSHMVAAIPSPKSLNTSLTILIDNDLQGKTSD